MTFEQSVNLGLIMAGVALASSLLTIVATGLVNHYLENRRRTQEKQGKTALLLGQRFGLKRLHKMLDNDIEVDSIQDDLREALSDVKLFGADTKSELTNDFLAGYFGIMTEDMQHMYVERVKLYRESAILRSEDVLQSEEE